MEKPRDSSPEIAASNLPGTGSSFSNTSASSAFVDNLGGSRLPCLDGLRGIAVYLVVLSHFGLLNRFAPGNWGTFAVNIFFVISGFLITLLLIREFEDSQAVSLKHFYLRRTLRIFPAFYVCWAITLALGIALHRRFVWWEPIATFLYMGDYYNAFSDSPHTIMGIAWSLGIEEKFYLLWPLAFSRWAGQWSKLFKICLGCIALVWLNKIVRLHVFHSPFRYFEYAFDTRADVILAGCALALATRLPTAQKWFTLMARRAWLVIPTIALLVATVVGVSLDEQSRKPFYYTYVLAAQTVLLPVMFVQLITWSSARVFRPLNSRPARTLGDLSYGIYLYHLPMFWIARALTRGQVGHRLFMLIEIVLPAIAAYLSHQLVEKPFLRLKRRFSPH